MTSNAIVQKLWNECNIHRSLNCPLRRIPVPRPITNSGM